MGGHTAGPVLLPVPPICPQKGGAAPVPSASEWKGMVIAVAATSVPIGTREAQCQQPAPFPQLCSGILPACWQVSGPCLSQFLSTEEEPSMSHCTNTRFPQLPLGQPGLPGLVTGSQSPLLRASGTQELKSAGDLGVSCSSLCGPSLFKDGETEAPRGKEFARSYTETQWQNRD